MKKFCLTGLLISVTSFLFAQNIDGVINAKEVLRIESVLASDEMGGRRAFTPQIDKAADFIASEFKKAGLQTLNNSGSYLQSFAMVSPKFISGNYTLDGQAVDPKDVIVVTTQANIRITEKSGYEKVAIKKGQSLFAEARKFAGLEKKYLVLVDTSFSKNFRRLTAFNKDLFKTENSVVFVLSATDPSTFTIEATNEITEKKLSNVVGILPGKSKKNEYVIFSGHYDHLGTGTPLEGYPYEKTDSIYNGANDDAAGTTAVIMLAKYFSALKNNERTIVFATFTAEELGGYGAKYFSQQFNPAAVVAMFNIEMVGTESKWGKNSSYITG